MCSTRLNQIAAVLGLNLKITLDPEFEILFPTRVKNGDWREAHEAQPKKSPGSPTIGQDGTP